MVISLNQAMRVGPDDGTGERSQVLGVSPYAQAAREDQARYGWKAVTYNPQQPTTQLKNGQRAWTDPPPERTCRRQQTCGKVLGITRHERDAH